MNNNERKILRLLIVVAGIVLGQVILYGPSLAGWKILLPLDILTAHNVYIPQAPASPGMEPQNVVLSDLVYQFEPARRFAVSEIHQGRFPLWATYHYGGVPFVWPKYSLFLLLECCVKSPVILAWAQLVAALVAGAGMYFFCRRSLGVSFWPASVCAWCYPLTAFFVLWQGFPTGLAVYWLPWIFLCVDKTMRGASPLAAMGLSVVTFLTLTSGHIDVAGQVLLGSGIYAVWCLWDAHRVGWPIRKLRRAITLLVMGWGLGFLLAAPHLLPLIEYAKTGSRILQRSNGAEERPPTGLVALPQIVLPDIYGTFDRGCLYIIPANGGTNLTESAAAGYTGVLATLVVAPLAWCSRRRRTLNAFWIFLGVFGLGWCLDIPGFVNLLRLPGLNMMSHNRLVFLTSFAILSMTAIGLENLVQGPVRRRWWFWLPAALLAGLFGWCIYRSHVLPEPVASKVEYGLAHGQTYGTIQNIHDLRHAQAWFIQHYTVMALFCGLGFAGWLLLWFQKTGVFRLFPVLAVFLVGDLLWFDHGRSAQCDPSLYYPKIPALDAVAKSVPGRVVGAGCLPASVSLMAGLNDICGYDSIDPARMVGLLNTTGEPVKEPTYAATQFLTPKGEFLPPAFIRLSPILDMLDVRYTVFRGVPPPSIHPQFQSDDYWILVNSNALPRTFIPKSVSVIPNDKNELEALMSPQFNPRDVAFVETPVELPADCRGTAQIINETPTRVTLTVNMESPGLIVLADNWDKGWRACYNGKPTPVLRANYSIRGVVVPAGNGTLEFVYRPASLVLGLWLAGIAAMILLCWLMLVYIQGRAAKTTQVKPNLQIDPAPARC